jgi:hypothetical protein
MYIFRTHPENIEKVVSLRKHALDRQPNLAMGDRVLISQTITNGDGLPPIRYVMTYFRTLPDLHDETLAIWGRKWPYIMEFDSCHKLSKPFDIRDVKVSNHEYGPGGPIVRVHPADEYAIDQAGLLR